MFCFYEPMKHFLADLRLSSTLCPAFKTEILPNFKLVLLDSFLRLASMIISLTEFLLRISFCFLFCSFSRPHHFQKTIIIIKDRGNYMLGFHLGISS